MTVRKGRCSIPMIERKIRGLWTVYLAVLGSLIIWIDHLHAPKGRFSIKHDRKDRRKVSYIPKSYQNLVLWVRNQPHPQGFPFRNGPRDRPGNEFTWSQSKHWVNFNFVVKQFSRVNVSPGCTSPADTATTLIIVVFVSIKQVPGSLWLVPFESVLTGFQCNKFCSRQKDDMNKTNKQRIISSADIKEIIS